MNKGFTLVELLIVVVIVGTLITVALPKYQNSLERGRALEGLRNVQYVAEYVAAKHMATGEWPSDAELDQSLKVTDIIKSRFFTLPVFNKSAKTVTISRKGDWTYSLKAKISDDVVSEITCTGADCASLDLTGNLMTRK